MMKREPVLHGLTEKPRSRRSSATRSRSMMSKVRPNLLSSSSFHCTVMAGGAVTTMKSIRRRSRSSRATSPASIVLPSPTSSAINRLTRGSRKRLAQRQELIGVEPDAGAERRLQEITIRSRGGAPADRAQMRPEHFGAVRCAASKAVPTIVRNNVRADLGVPEDLDLLALRVVGDAGEAQRCEVRCAVVDRLDEPGTAAHLDELPLLDHAAVQQHPDRGFR